MIDSDFSARPRRQSRAPVGCRREYHAGTANVAEPAEAGADFGAMLSHLASNAASVVRQAEATSIAGIQGKPRCSRSSRR